MPREYHSASSTKMAELDGKGCDRAWAYCYIAKLRQPDVAWADIESGKIRVLPYGEQVPEGLEGVCCTVKQRSAALGTAVHAVLEAYYRGQPLPHGGLPYAIAMSPHARSVIPQARPEAVPEQYIGDTPRPGDTRMPYVLDLLGVHWGGKIDLVEPGHIWDWKTTSSIAKYSKTSDELRVDLALALYGVHAMTRQGLGDIGFTWPYFETGKIRRVLPVSGVVTHDECITTVRRYLPVIHRLDALTSVEDAAKNLQACADYGGCPYHASAGGPCDAMRSVAAMRSNVPMAKSLADLKSKFAKISDAPVEAPPPPHPPVEAPAEQAEPSAPEPEVLEPDEVTPAPEPPKPAPSKKKAKPPEPPPPAVAAPLDDIAPVERLRGLLAQREAIVAQIRDTLKAIEAGL